MTIPRFGENVPARFGLSVTMQLGGLRRYPEAIWRLVEQRLNEVFASEQRLSEFAEDEFGLTLPILGGSSTMVYKASFVMSMDWFEQEQFREDLRNYLLECGGKWLRIELNHLD